MYQTVGRTRAIQILQSLREGRSLEEVKVIVPNMVRQGAPGLSSSSIHRAERNALHMLAVIINRGERPEWLPAELWPPDEVRAAVCLDKRLASKYSRLRGWLTGFPEAW